VIVSSAVEGNGAGFEEERRRERNGNSGWWNGKVIHIIFTSFFSFTIAAGVRGAETSC
jgi:hypothetical protein